MIFCYCCTFKKHKYLIISDALELSSILSPETYKKTSLDLQCDSSLEQNQSVVINKRSPSVFCVELSIRDFYLSKYPVRPLKISLISSIDMQLAFIR